MDRKSLIRTVLAVAISLAILFGWEQLSPLIWPPKPKPKVEEPAAVTPAEPKKPAKTTSVPAPPDVTEKETKAPAAPAEPAEVEAVKESAPEVLPPLVPEALEKGTPVTLGSTAADSPYDLEAVIEPTDAAVGSVALTGFFKSVKDRDKPDREKFQLIQPIAAADRKGPRSFAISEIEIWDKASGAESIKTNIEGAVWEYVEEESSPERAVFRLFLCRGKERVLEITKVFTISPRKGLADAKDRKIEDGNYELGLKVKFRDLSGRIEHLQYTLAGPAGLPREDVRYDMRHVVVGQWKGNLIAADLRNGSKVLEAQERKWKEEHPEETRKAPLPAVDVATDKIAWAGSDDKYFAVVVVPLPVKPDADLISAVVAGTYDEPTPLGAKATVAQAHLVVRKSPLAESGGVIENSFVIFAGPKDENLLEKQYANYNFPALIVWSSGCCTCIPGVHYISKFMVWAINAFYKFTFNYGLSIILLVIIIRVALHPATRWNQKSMTKMQKLAPLMQEIKERCGDDKKRFQQETMLLYKEHGVNPVTGCLPMFIQMPIWIGLYGALMVAISLRQAPFALWIQDLSQPDALVAFSRPYVIPGGNIPLLGALINMINNGMLGGGITSLNILPLLTAVGMYLQQHMMPKSTTGPQAAQQKHMMLFMMVFLALVLYNAPAGLNLYICTSTVLGFFEQRLIRRHLERVAVPAAGAPAVPSKKQELGSGRFRSPAERLEAWLARRVGAKKDVPQQPRDKKKRGK